METAGSGAAARRPARRCRPCAAPPACGAAHSVASTGAKHLALTDHLSPADMEQLGRHGGTAGATRQIRRFSGKMHTSATNGFRLHTVWLPSPSAAHVTAHSFSAGIWFAKDPMSDMLGAAACRASGWAAAGDQPAERLPMLWNTACSGAAEQWAAPAGCVAGHAAELRQAAGRMMVSALSLGASETRERISYRIGY